MLFRSELLIDPRHRDQIWHDRGHSTRRRPTARFSLPVIAKTAKQKLAPWICSSRRRRYTRSVCTFFRIQCVLVAIFSLNVLVTIGEHLYDKRLFWFLALTVAGVSEHIRTHLRLQGDRFTARRSEQRGCDVVSRAFNIDDLDQSLNP